MHPRILAVGEEPPPLLDTTASSDKMPPSKAKNPKKPGNTGGRFQSINAFLDVTLAGLDRAELAVWLLLWRDTKQNGLARTSQEDLARRAGCTARSVRRALTRLVALGLVRIVQQGGLKRRLSVYHVKPLCRDTTEDVGVRHTEDVGVPDRGRGRPTSQKGP